MGNTSRNYALVDDVSTKNFIINGAVDFYQRQPAAVGETALSGTAVYTVDRFTGKIQPPGTFGATTRIARVSSPSSPIVDCLYSLNVKAENPSASGNIIRVTQRIESSVVRELAGRTASLSFYINRSATPASASTLTVSMATPTTQDGFGTMNSAFTLPGGAASASFSFGGAGTWVLCQLHGISIPSNATNGLEVTFDFTGWDTTATISNQQITAIMLNAGLKCAAFKRHGATLADELIACQRYFEKSYNVDTPVDTSTANGMASSSLGQILGDGAMCTVAWKVSKRPCTISLSHSVSNLGTPQTLSLWNQVGDDNVWQSFTASNVGTNRTPIVNWASEYGMQVSLDNSSTDVFGQGHWVVDCEL